MVASHPIYINYRKLINSKSHPKFPQKVYFAIYSGQIQLGQQRMAIWKWMRRVGVRMIGARPSFSMKKWSKNF